MKSKLTLALASSILTLTLSAFPHHAAAGTTSAPPPPPTTDYFRIYLRDAVATPVVSILMSILPL
jgi:hypothetical protein